MKSLIWFVVGAIFGEFWSSWLMHVIYISIIVTLLAGGNYWCLA